VKEASANFTQISNIIEISRGLEFSVISGDDGLTLPMMASGRPESSQSRQTSFRSKWDGSHSYALKATLRKRRRPLSACSTFQALFIETNPIPIKKACDLLGLAADAQIASNHDGRANVVKLKETLAAYAD